MMVEGTLSLRVCAMYGFNRKVLMSLAIAALTTVGLGAWAVIGPETVLETSQPGCHVTTPKSQRSVRMGRPIRMIALVNLANIIMLYIITAGSLAWVACSISVTMISRLMLNLHDTANHQLETVPPRTSARRRVLCSVVWMECTECTNMTNGYKHALRGNAPCGVFFDTR
ncbi:hypothetical protein B0H13DRAFT_1888905 [Mycena leptocephala]|nr:hypothetical protein B0H13DRAFT_1888905 [Mycena leptocephala]